jgi:uncharacterized membrane protein
MIDWDNGPAALMIWVILVFVAPFIYSFFVDKWDKNTKGIDTYSH